MLDNGLQEVTRNIIPAYLSLANGDKIVFWIEDILVGNPSIPNGLFGVKNHKVYPSECRQRAITYKGKLMIKVGFSINGKKQDFVEKQLGEIPIMIKVCY